MNHRGWSVWFLYGFTMVYLITADEADQVAGFAPSFWLQFLCFYPRIFFEGLVCPVPLVGSFNLSKLRNNPLVPRSGILWILWYFNRTLQPTPIFYEFIPNLLLKWNPLGETSSSASQFQNRIGQSHAMTVSWKFPDHGSWWSPIYKGCKKAFV